MKKPLENRVLVNPQDKSHRTFKQVIVKPDHREIARLWERGAPCVLQGLPNIAKLPKVLSLLADFVSGQEDEEGDVIQGSAQKRWRLDCAYGSTVYSLGDENIFIVRDTGDYDNDVEGGYTSIYSVIFSNVAEDKSMFTYDVRSFPIPPCYTRKLKPGENEPYVPRGPVFTDANKMRRVYDEELSELSDRGVRVAIIPDRWY